MHIREATTHHLYLPAERHVILSACKCSRAFMCSEPCCAPSRWCTYTGTGLVFLWCALAFPLSLLSIEAASYINYFFYCQGESLTFWELLKTVAGAFGGCGLAYPILPLKSFVLLIRVIDLDLMRKSLCSSFWYSPSCCKELVTS